MNMTRLIYTIAILIALLLINTVSKANEIEDEISLKGNWSFKIGDNPSWAAMNFNDSDWNRIYAPARWEDEGYPNYDGFAWYRKKVTFPSSFRDKRIILELGYIDDIDEVFVNGQKIGQTGDFPPEYKTAYSSYRKYEVPNNIIRPDAENIIAVRVYDSQIEGGIIKGTLRIYTSGIALIPDINLSGKWAFSKGKTFNIDNAKTITVPGKWENQGYNDYDGWASYSRKFELSKQYSGERMIMLAGRIDDNDEVYINGKFIASTGISENNFSGSTYSEFRNYVIPDGILKPGDNLIEIRVYDISGEGGIIEGPVGLITQTKFIKYWKAKRRNS